MLVPIRIHLGAEEPVMEEHELEAHAGGFGRPDDRLPLVERIRQEFAQRWLLGSWWYTGRGIGRGEERILAVPCTGPDARPVHARGTHRGQGLRQRRLPALVPAEILTNREVGRAGVGAEARALRMHEACWQFLARVHRDRELFLGIVGEIHKGRQYQNY